MKKNIELENTLPESVIYPNAEDSVIMAENEYLFNKYKRGTEKETF